jgi:hypothetical protein
MGRLGSLLTICLRIGEEDCKNQGGFSPGKISLTSKFQKWDIFGVTPLSAARKQLLSAKQRSSRTKGESHAS